MISPIEPKPIFTQSASPRIGLSSHLFGSLQRIAPVPRRLKTVPTFEGLHTTVDGSLSGREGNKTQVDEGRRRSLERANEGRRRRTGGRGDQSLAVSERRGGNEAFSLEQKRRDVSGEGTVELKEARSTPTSLPSRQTGTNLRPSSPPFVDRTINNLNPSASSLPAPPPPPHQFSFHHTSQSWDNLLGVHPSSAESPTGDERASPSPLLLLHHQPYPVSRPIKNHLSSNSVFTTLSLSHSSDHVRQLGKGPRPFTPPGRALLVPPSPSSTSPVSAPPTNFTIITTQRFIPSQSSDSNASSHSSSSSSSSNNNPTSSPTTSPRLLVVPLAPPNPTARSRRPSLISPTSASSKKALLVVPSPPLSLATSEVPLDKDGDDEKGMLTLPLRTEGSMAWGHVDTPTVEMKEEEMGLSLGLKAVNVVLDGIGLGRDEEGESEGKEVE